MQENGENLCLVNGKSATISIVALRLVLQSTMAKWE